MAMHRDEGMSRESMMAHVLAHTYGASAVGMIVVYGDGTQVAVQLHCGITDAAEQECIAQCLRQGCASMSKQLRVKYIERAGGAGDAPPRTPLRVVRRKGDDDGGGHNGH
jgi:hypothetical protein